ncbi:MAG: CocE/NonD family hydrolase [Eubacteriales bacterium]|nr:CocE/NonD family hydrolase [Eubacteriales bacterium]
MKIWNFYYSGIYYGSLRASEKGVQHTSLDPETGEKRDWEELPGDNLYRRLSNRDIRALFLMLGELSALSADGKERFSSSDGGVFSRRHAAGEYEAEWSGAQTAYIERNRKYVRDLLSRDGELYAVLMPGRDYTAVLVQDGMEAYTPLKCWDALYPAENPEFREAAENRPHVRFLGSFRVETADHEFLATDVYLPAGKEGPFPAVLVRTPYGKKNGKEQYFRFVQRGYAVVLQDVRGREDSTGAWRPNYYEVEDGRDTLAWIAAQSWSDQKIAMTGGSYLGYVQWAAAASGSPYLKAMLSSVCAGSAFVDVPRRGGTFCSGMLAWGFAMTEQRMRADLMVRDDWDEVLEIRPLGDIPEKALGHAVPFLDEWFSHRDEDAFWKRSSWQAAWRETEQRTGRKIEVPALIMSGWFDDNGMGTTEALELVRSYAPGNYKAILGPWMHSGNANYDLHGVFLGERALRYDMDVQCFAWLERFLRGREIPLTDTAVEYYTLSENRWKTADAWPLPAAEELSLYLQADGSLQKTAPSLPGQNAYDYDPAHPAVHIIDLSENELEVPEDYTEEEKRADVMVYSTEVLTEPLTVTGDMTAVLYLSSDCPDTDLIVHITDVDETGRSVKLADGMLSVRYRGGFDRPELMKPGEVYKIRIRTTKLSNCFLAGHRLRFTVTSSAKNFIFPNCNTGEGYDSREQRIAHNVIHTGGDFPSRIILRLE